jgi:hypothetical protein
MLDFIFVDTVNWNQEIEIRGVKYKSTKRGRRDGYTTTTCIKMLGMGLRKDKRGCVIIDNNEMYIESYIKLLKEITGSEQIYSLNISPINDDYVMIALTSSFNRDIKDTRDNSLQSDL